MITTPLTHAEKARFRLLHNRSERASQGLFIAEGKHVVEDLIQGHLDIDCVIVRSDASEESLDIARQLDDKGVHIFTASVKEIDQLTDARTPQDILAVVRIPQPRKAGTRILAVDGVADPGNMGTMIRTASWFGFSDLICSTGCVDVFNTKVVRSAAGALSRMNVIQDANLATTLQELGIRTILGAVPRGGITPSEIDIQDSIAIVVGSESHGISDETLHICTQLVTLPGGHGTESLNASIAAAILCYEVTRS